VRQTTWAVVSSPSCSRSNLAVAVRSASAVGLGVGGNGKQTT